MSVDCHHVHVDFAHPLFRLSAQKSLLFLSHHTIPCSGYQESHLRDADFKPPSHMSPMISIARDKSPRNNRHSLWDTSITVQRRFKSQPTEKAKVTSVQHFYSS